MTFYLGPIEDAPNLMAADVFRGRVFAEYVRACKLHPQPIHNVQEGYAILYEELCEFFDEVRKKPSERSTEALRTELVQLAAMCLRTAVDCSLMEPT